MDILIREMQNSDIESIMEIESTSFGKYHWSANSFENEISNSLGNYFVAINKETDELVGYAGFWNILDEGHITTFAVKKEHRQKGIAKEIMFHLIEKGYAHEIKWFTLEVRASNLPAISFYTKFGFQNIGVREKYYQDNDEDALIMWTENIYSDKFKSRIEKLKER